MSVRLADERDMGALLRIEEDCFGAERFSPDTIRAFLQRDDTFVLIAEEGGLAVGSAMCIVSRFERQGRIASIAIMKQHRKRGIGSKLLEECESMLLKNDLTRLSLEVETINEPAIALYSTRGYEVKGLLRDFYGFGRHAFYMEKRIPARGRSVKIKPS